MIRTIFSLICLVAAGSIFFLYTKPEYDKVQTTSAEIAQYDQALEKAAELQQLKQSLLARYNTFSPTDVDRLQKLLPDHVDNVRLILDIDSLAGRHAMALQNVVVSSAESVQTTNQSATAAVGASKQKYDSVTLKFTTQGTYDTFLAFLGDLEQSLRIVDLVSLSLSNSAATPGREPIYTYDVTLRTYWLK